MGKFIGSGYGFAVKKELPPGGSSPFAVSVHSYSLHGKTARYEAFYSALPTRLLASSLLALRQRLVEVGDNVFDGFEADGQAHVVG